MFDVVFCVFGCDTIPKYRAEILKIHETWGTLALKYPERVKVLFFLGEEVGPLEGDEYIRLTGVENDYISASYKQFLGLKYIHDNYETKFVFCCGTDTYVNIPMLLNYLKNFNYTDNLYIGGHGREIQIGARRIHFHMGGGGIILSLFCLRKLYPYLIDAVTNWWAILEEANIKVEDKLKPACDVAIAYYLQLPEVDAIVVKPDDYMFAACNHKGYWLQYEKCTGHGDHNYSRLISCHWLSLTQFDEYTYIIIDYNFFI